MRPRPSRDSALRFSNSLEAVMAAGRADNYSAALDAAEGLKDGTSQTAPYCFYRRAIQVHYHAGKAYLALHHAQKSGSIFVRRRRLISKEYFERWLARPFPGRDVESVNHMRRILQWTVLPSGL